MCLFVPSLLHPFVDAVDFVCIMCMFIYIYIWYVSNVTNVLKYICGILSNRFFCISWCNFSFPCSRGGLRKFDLAH